MRPRAGFILLLSAGLLGGLAATATMSFMPRAMAAMPAPAPQPASIALCDVYALIERHVEGEQFRPARDAEQERIKAQLTPLETELDALQKDLQSANPQDPGAQAKYATFQQKREQYQQTRQRLVDAYSELVAKQFTQALSQVSAEAKKVANELGYTHVIAQKTSEMTAKDPRQLVEEFLSRPFAAYPAESDITEKVREAMKLPKAPLPTPAAIPTPTTPAAPTTPTSPPSTPATSSPTNSAPTHPSEPAATPKP